MAMKRVYRCDICSDVIENPRDNLLGVYFHGNANFTLGDFGLTDGRHICHRCAEQLGEQLRKMDFGSYKMKLPVKIVSVDSFRSKPLLNMSDDMVRVEFDCSMNVWREIRKLLEEEE